MTHNKPAFPNKGREGDYKDQNGMTLQQYAAIHLKVPNSGEEWLDEIIREARRLDYVGMALQSLLSAEGAVMLLGKNPTAKLFNDQTAAKAYASGAYKLADALMKEGE